MNSIPPLRIYLLNSSFEPVGHANRHGGGSLRKGQLYVFRKYRISRLDCWLSLPLDGFPPHSGSPVLVPVSLDGWMNGWMMLGLATRSHRQQIGIYNSAWLASNRIRSFAHCLLSYVLSPIPLSPLRTISSFFALCMAQSMDDWLAGRSVCRP